MAKIEMKVIGLTGGIGSGKTTVSVMLAELGAGVVDADRLGHQLLQRHSEAWQQVVAAFGREILQPSEEIDRARLGEIVFKDAGVREKLNRIMWPRILARAKQDIEALRQQGARVTVLEAAAMIEAGWQSEVDEVWVTVASPSTIVERLMTNKGFTWEQVMGRVSSQMSASERARYAQVVVNTDCTLDELRQRVRQLWQERGLGQDEPPDELRETIRQLLARRPKGRFRPSRKGLVPAAVLLLLYRKGRQYYILFTRRTEQVGYHKQQISFPGGGRHREDASPVQTALREAREEIGLRPQDVEVLGELDRTETTVSSFVVTPVVGFIHSPYPFHPSPGEVAEILEVPLSALLEQRNLTEGKGPDGDIAYEYQGEVIWGATARILKQFLELLFPEPGTD